jgi:hypothetical protein
MEVGLLIRFGKLVPGREEQAIELFKESSKFYESKVQEGVLSHFEPFFLKTSDLEEETGFFILKGQAPQVFKMMEEETYLSLMMKGELVVQHMRADLLTVGEGIFDELARAGKVRAELGI